MVVELFGSSKAVMELSGGDADVFEVDSFDEVSDIQG